MFTLRTIYLLAFIFLVPTVSLLHIHTDKKNNLVKRFICLGDFNSRNVMQISSFIEKREQITDEQQCLNSCVRQTQYIYQQGLTHGGRRGSLERLLWVEFTMGCNFLDK